MIVSDAGQARVFFINIAFGIACVILYDFFSVVTKKYVKSSLMINLVDVLYFAMAFLIIFFAGVKYNFGALRYYQIMGLLFGMGVWYGFFSRIDEIVFEYFTEKFLVLAKLCGKIIYKPTMFSLRVLVTPIAFAEEKTLAFFGKLKRKRAKVIKRREKIKKTNIKRRKMI